jgi:hypothetical protein
MQLGGSNQQSSIDKITQSVLWKLCIKNDKKLGFKDIGLRQANQAGSSLQDGCNERKDTSHM